MFIVLSVLEVTQRVPPTCTRKTSRTADNTGVDGNRLTIKWYTTAPSYWTKCVSNDHALYLHRRKKTKLQACIHAMCFHSMVQFEINMGNKYVPALKIISSCNGPNTINRTDFTRSHRVVNQCHTTRVAWTSMVQKNEQLFKKLLNEWKKNEKKMNKI